MKHIQWGELRRQRTNRWLEAQAVMDNHAADFRRFKRRAALRTIGIILTPHLFFLTPVALYFVGVDPALLLVGLMVGSLALLFGALAWLLLHIWCTWRNEGRSGLVRALRSAAYWIVLIAATAPFAASGGYLDQWLGPWWPLAIPTGLILFLLADHGLRRFRIGRAV